MDFSEEELNEFRVEAREMLDSAEEQLLSIEKGESPLKFYDGIFRVMHSLKGGAGMLGLSALQSHMHTLESLFSTFKGAPAIPAENTSLFLKAIDVARLILNGKQVAFQFEKSNTTPIANPNPTSIPQKPEVRNQAKEKHKHGAESALIYSIDDEQDILDIVKEEVELAGHQCKTFTEAEALFAEIKKNAPDVVLSDMKMPKITGHEVIKEYVQSIPIFL